MQIMSISIPTDPTDLAVMRLYLASVDPDARLSALAMQRVEISDSAHLHVGDAVQQALGAGIHAVAEIGLHNNILAAANAMTGVDETYTPNADAHRHYSQVFQAYRTIYPNLKSTFQSIAENMP